MKYFNLPEGEKVSRIILGCWAFAGGANWGHQDESDSIETIHAALDLGINTLDTALVYGNGLSQKIVGKAIRDRRSEVVIYDKIPQARLGYDDAIATVEECLSNLGIETIDVIQIHWSNPDIPMEETIRAIEKLKSDGKIRYFGVCNFGPKQMESLLRYAKPISNQVAYSLIARAIEFDIQPLCHSQSIDILAYSPLMQGLLTGKYRTVEDVPAGRMRTRHFSGERSDARHGGPGYEEQTFKAIGDFVRICEREGLEPADVALAWILHQPSLAATICGARNVEQVQKNVKGAEDRLSDDLLRQLEGISDPLKEQMGSNADLWNSETRIF